jgi:hypothetical protein
LEVTIGHPSQRMIEIEKRDFRRTTIKMRGIAEV